MRPAQQARRVYDLEPCARRFVDDLELHLLRGFVVSTPEYFIMGRPVPRMANPALILNPAVDFDLVDCDCWHIYLAAGRLDSFWLYYPIDLPWVSWERRNRLRFHRMERIRTRIL